MILEFSTRHLLSYLATLRWILPAGIVSLFTVGCVASKVEQNLRDSVSVRQTEIDRLREDLNTDSQQTLSWDDARNRMLKENLGLQQSRQALAQTERETKRQWLGLVPRMAAFVNLSQGLTTIADIGSNDLNASLIGSFNIPNPFDFYASLYGAALQAHNARWSQELDERRAYTELYSAFLDAKALSEETATMEHRKMTFAVDESADLAKALYSLEMEKEGLKRRLIAHRGNVNRLLNTPGGNWELTGHIPAISYKSRYRKIKIGDDFGKMALKLYAVRIESAVMQTQRVKYQQWPTIGFGLSNPPLYSNNGQNDLSVEDFNLFSGANKSLDVTDIGGRQAIQDAETRMKFTREQLLLSMEREAARILQIEKTYGQLLAEERRLQAAMKRLDRPASSESEVVIDDLDSRSKLELQLIQAQRQIGQLDLQYLIWDERYWK
jgi:hypothetical protein